MSRAVLNAGISRSGRDRCPRRPGVTTVLTATGKAVTDRRCATGERPPTGQHPGEWGCAAHAIDHRLIQPRHPQTHGRVARFNGRRAALLATGRCRSGEHRENTLTRSVNTSHHFIPPRALGHIRPGDALKEWYQKQPEWLVSEVNNLPGLDSPTVPQEYGF